MVFTTPRVQYKLLVFHDVSDLLFLNAQLSFPSRNLCLTLETFPFTVGVIVIKH